MESVVASERGIAGGSEHLPNDTHWELPILRHRIGDTIELGNRR
jgi:hypothetical protein